MDFEQGTLRAPVPEYHQVSFKDFAQYVPILQPELACDIVGLVDCLIKGKEITGRVDQSTGSSAIKGIDLYEIVATLAFGSGGSFSRNVRVPKSKS